MRKHAGTPSRHDKYVRLAAISPTGEALCRLVFTILPNRNSQLLSNAMVATVSLSGATLSFLLVLVIFEIIKQS